MSYDTTIRRLELIDIDGVREMESMKNEWPNAKEWTIPKAKYPKLIGYLSKPYSINNIGEKDEYVIWNGITIRAV